MTRGKWIILGLLVILAAILVEIAREKFSVAESQTTTTRAEKSLHANRKTPPAFRRRSRPVSAEKSEQPAQKAGRHLLVIVQDEMGLPLPEAQVRSKIQTKKKQSALTNFNAEVTADLNGVADVLWPAENFKQLEVTVSKTNYSARKMVWDFETGDTVPPSYTIQLKQGFHIGGFVVDPESNPVPGAKVSAYRFWSGDDGAPRSKGEQSAFSRINQTTDADGRWTMRDLPVELLDHIGVEATHTNFISAHVNLSDAKSEKELRAETYKFVLGTGMKVSGGVLDEHDNPISGAKVWAGRKYFANRRETKTDEQGNFSIHNLDPKSGGWESEHGILFSAMADGYAPESQTVNIDTNANPQIIFHLKPGAVIAGKVVDKAGKPIEKVRVSLEGNSPGGERYESYEFSTTTDNEGKFAWKSAPNQPMPFYIGKSGYQQKRGVRLKPGEENVVTLLHNRKVIGKVLDAETGRPVTEFHIVSGRQMGERFYGQSYGAKDFTSEDGSFTFEIGEEQNNSLQASAKDYAEKSEFLPPAKDEEPVQVTFQLKPSPALEGVVLTPNGQPVAGAKVALVEEGFGGRSVQLSNGRMRAFGSNSKLATTDASGKFIIASPPENGTVVASADEGFGSASIAEVRSSRVLTLQVFGRIEGLLIRGSTVAEGEELMLSSPGGGGVSFDFNGYKATTDVNGRFTFEKVPAGAWAIVRLVKTSSRSWMHSHSTPVTVIAGQTATVTLGGVDATLQGHVSFETPPEETDLTITGKLRTSMPQIPQGLSPDELRALISSPEWKAQQKNTKHYSVSVGKDGSLLLDSIEPGDYTLTVTAQKHSGESPIPTPVASGETKVNVPVGSNPNSPINVGEIVLRPVEKSAPQIWTK